MASEKGKEKVKKEPLKTRNPYKYYRNIHYGLYSGSWVAVIAPIVTVFAVKWNEYFDFVNNTGDSVKLTIGCVAAIVLGVIFAIKKAKVDERQKGTYSMLHYVAFVGVLWAILFLFKAIIDDAFLITSVELGGAVAAYGLNIADKKAKEQALLYKSVKDDDKKESIKKDMKAKRKVDLL